MIFFLHENAHAHDSFVDAKTTASPHALKKFQELNAPLTRRNAENHVGDDYSIPFNCCVHNISYYYVDSVAWKRDCRYCVRADVRKSPSHHWSRYANRNSSLTELRRVQKHIPTYKPYILSTICYSKNMYTLFHVYHCV